MFPEYPDRKELIETLSFISNNTHFGTRIDGFITPLIEGFYSFSLQSDDNSQFWLQLDKNDSKLELIASIGTYQVPGWSTKRSITNHVFLKAHVMYYFLLYHKQAGGRCFFDLRWKRNDDIDYSIIPSNHFSVASSLVGKEFQYNTESKFRRKARMRYSSVKIYPMLTPTLSICSHLTKHGTQVKLKNYEGVYKPELVNVPIQVYPDDGTQNLVEICDETKPDIHCSGNNLLSESDAKRMVTNVMDRIHGQNGR